VGTTEREEEVSIRKKASGKYDVRYYDPRGRHTRPPTSTLLFISSPSSGNQFDLPDRGENARDAFPCDSARDY